jgi:ribA/ribD-fused uncharacterized protein
MDVISSFRGDYFFLSNYYTAPFTWRGIEFHSGEQAFAYAKTFFQSNGASAAMYQQRILNAKTPGDAKKIGRNVDINVKEWDANKVQYMREITHAKFSTAGDGIAGKLINTGSAMLVEGNTWGDKYWGRCLEDGKMVGLNKLGVILMEERGYWLHSDFSDKE